jgi:hypothetical protein
VRKDNKWLRKSGGKMIEQAPIKSGPYEYVNHLYFKAIHESNAAALEALLSNFSHEVKQKLFQSNIFGFNALEHSLVWNCPAMALILLKYGYELTETDKEIILDKVKEEHWHATFQAYFENIKKFEKTPTLLDMTADKISRFAQREDRSISLLELPSELETLCKKAPLMFDLRSHYLKPQHVKDYLKEILETPEAKLKASQNIRKRLERAEKALAQPKTKKIRKL